MNDTIAYYNDHAEEFVEGTAGADMSVCRERFLAYLKENAKILDAGCGSGRDAMAFMECGYEVDAFDASPEICRIASERIGKDVRCARFEDLEGEAEYDGIWACASLLHVKTEELADVMRRLCRLLREDGILYMSFKQGDAERIKNGRFFRDMTEESCRQLAEGAGLHVEESFISSDVRDGRDGEKWVNVIAKKRVLF